ncbi:MAG: DNA integrity scanning protein DisA nucleotide-binding domain protein [Archangium sp.]|nr:DNA integrity scanning protein DisA nucleotide-binding domain protein [Archangium sp.]
MSSVDLEPPDRFVPALAKHLAACHFSFIDKMTLAGMRAVMDELAPLPSEEQLRRLMNAVFYGSIWREEGRAVVVTVELTTKRALGFVHRPHLLLDKERQLEPSLIAKLSPALRPPLHLAVDPAELTCWGMVDDSEAGLSDPSLRIRVIRPGHFALSYFWQTRFLYSAGSGVLTGFVDQPDAELERDLQFQSALPMGPINSAVTRWTLSSLAVEAVASGHGATFIVLPGAVVPSTQVERSYSVREAFALREAVAAWDKVLPGPQLLPKPEVIKKESAYRKAVKAVGHLAGVDGAVLFSAELQLLAFGAILASPSFTGTIEPAGRPTGSRHNSAINFVGANAGAVAVVVSQDGAVTVIANSSGTVTCTRLDEIRSLGPTFFGGGAATG